VNHQKTALNNLSVSGEKVKGLCDTMGLMALGINYQSAPIAIRETFTFSHDAASQVVCGLVRDAVAFEAVLLSTCNRTELYCDTVDPLRIFSWLEGHNKLLNEDVRKYSYSYSDISAVRHIMRVASGLDSMVLGEGEILGQLKTAFGVASQAGTIGKFLGRLFQTTFSVAKMVRTETGVGINPVSLGYAAARLSERIFSDLKEVRVLLIGAGDIIRLTAKHLQRLGVKKWVVANRTLARAELLASQLKGVVIEWDMIFDQLPNVDIVITGTGSALPILHKNTVEWALKQRKRRPMFMVDLAVPRDIEPCVAELEDVYLYCIDDLKALVEDNRTARKEAAVMAERIIALKAEQFMGWIKAESAWSTLHAFREKFERVRDQEVEDALKKLRGGQSPEVVLQRLAHGLTGRLLHEPTLKLREAGFEGNQELLALTRDLFELNDEIG